MTNDKETTLFQLNSDDSGKFKTLLTVTPRGKIILNQENYSQEEVETILGNFGINAPKKVLMPLSTLKFEIWGNFIV